MTAARLCISLIHLSGLLDKAKTKSDPVCIDQNLMLQGKIASQQSLSKKSPQTAKPKLA